MNRRVCGWVLWIAASAGSWAQTATPPSTSVQTTAVVEPPSPLLPANDRFVVNDALAAVPTDKPETADVLKESGLKRTETRAVMIPLAGTNIGGGWARAYRFVDATGAYAAYTYLRQGGRPRGDDRSGISSSELPDGEIVLLDGVSVVRAKINQHRDAVGSLLSTVETGLPKVGGAQGVPPLLPRLLPRAGLQADSLRYAIGPVQYGSMGGVLPASILGWDKSAEAVTAQYAGRKGSGTLTLLLYPTPEIAGDRGRAVQNAVNQRGAASFGTVKLRRIGPMLAMTSGGWTPEQAETLVGSVNLNQEVTFDKAMPSEFHVEIKKTVTLLESIGIFTGVGILAAVVLGVFLGGARAGIRVMQGKPAWTDPEFLRIDLRGRPEPLKPASQFGNDLSP